jgi:hypothetical protein
MTTEKKTGGKRVHHLPSYIAISEFARRKNVSRQSVINHIEDNKIITEMVGEAATPFIDWNKYKDYEFAK